MFKKNLNYNVLVFTLSLSLSPVNLYSMKSSSDFNVSSNQSILFREAYFKKLQKSNPKAFEEFPWYVLERKIKTLEDQKNYCLFIAAQIKDYNAIKKLRYCTSKYCLKLTLYHAIEKGDVACVQVLLDYNEENNPYVVGYILGKPCLFHAVKKNNDAMVGTLLSYLNGKISLQKHDPYELVHPLVQAACDGYLNIFTLLLPYSENKAIHEAFETAGYHGHTQIISYLFNEISFVPTSKELEEVLRIASGLDYYSTVEVLLGKGKKISLEGLNSAIDLAESGYKYRGISKRTYSRLLEYKKKKYPN